jgi:hypothetical protein
MGEATLVLNGIFGGFARCALYPRADLTQRPPNRCGFIIRMPVMGENADRNPAAKSKSSLLLLVRSRVVAQANDFKMLDQGGGETVPLIGIAYF